MRKREVEEICKDIDGNIIFNYISNGRYEYNDIRVVKYKIICKDGEESLIVEMTGFPQLENGNI
jgi:hypothetical protein